MDNQTKNPEAENGSQGQTAVSGFPPQSDPSIVHLDAGMRETEEQPGIKSYVRYTACGVVVRPGLNIDTNMKAVNCPDCLKALDIDRTAADDLGDLDQELTAAGGASVLPPATHFFEEATGENDYTACGMELKKAIEKSGWTDDIDGVTCVPCLRKLAKLLVDAQATDNTLAQLFGVKNARELGEFFRTALDSQRQTTLNGAEQTNQMRGLNDVLGRIADILASQLPKP